VLCRRLNNRFGFNLLEVVIAAFLFSTIAVAFLGVWGMQARGLEKSRHKLVATMLAEQIVEEAMAEGYELTRVTEEPETSEIEMAIENRNKAGEWISIPVVYQTERVVAEIGVDEDKLKQVIVKVTWEDSTNTGEVTLVTYMAGVF
jgi:type II secretory pathway pseudopilin PulG